MGMTKVDVAIVGAGFSGLSAALALCDAGQNVLLLEAQDRPGGRVWTVTGEDGHAYEKGGQCFATDMTHVYDLVQKYGLTRRSVRKVPGIVALLGGRWQILETDVLEHDFFERLFSEATDPAARAALWIGCWP